MQIAESDRTLFERLQSSARHQRIQIAGLDVAMPVEEVENTSCVSCRPFEIDNEPSPVRFQNLQYFARTFLASFGAEMMGASLSKEQHRNARRERAAPRDAFPEIDLSPRPGSLPFRLRNHFARGINSADHRKRANMPLSGNGERACAAANI